MRDWIIALIVCELVAYIGIKVMGTPIVHFFICCLLAGIVWWALGMAAEILNEIRPKDEN